MEANELRIGNLLINGIGEVFEVNGYAIFQIGLGISAIGGFEPIPLTPEWLERAGFEKSLFSYTLYTDTGLPLFRVENDDDCNCLVACIPPNQDEYYTREIHYVHQLQNLTFALTGKELEFKEI